MRKLLASLVLLALVAIARPAAAQVRINQLPSGTVSGTFVTICDNLSTSSKCTFNQLAAYFQANLNIVVPSGSITAGHCVEWLNSNTIEDAGAACGSGGGGSGTVTTVSIVSANGFAGTVANATSTPAITLSTSINGPLKGNGTALLAASAADIVNLFSACTGSQYLGADGACHNASGAGTVTSVGVTVPTFLSVTPATITSSGTFAISLSGTALPAANGGTGLTSLGTGVGAWLGTPSSANLLTALTDETGTGVVVANNSPTLITPALKGSSTGVTTIASANAGASNFTATLPATTDTIVELTATQTLTNKSIAASEVNSGQLGVANGGTGAATLTGPIKGNGTSAFTVAASADILGLWSGTCSSTTFLRGDGSCQTPAGGGTVSTTGSPATGNLTKFSGATSVTNGDLSGDVTTSGTLAATVVKINGTTLSGLATGILKNTTATGVPSIATSADVIADWSGTCSASTFLRGDGSCQTPAGGGNVSNSGTPTIHQTGVWQSATTISGVGPGTTGQAFASTGASTDPAYTATLSGVTSVNGTSIPSSATLLTSGGALGTPSSGTLTNATGLPLAGLATQVTATVVANTSGSTAAPTAVSLTSFQAALVAANANLVADATPGSGPLNDYSPTGYGTTTSVLYITPAGGGTTIDGIVAGSNMQQVFIINAEAAGGADLIKLVNQSASDTTAANRFLTSATVSLAIPPGGRVGCIYLAGSINRWSCQ